MPQAVHITAEKLAKDDEHRVMHELHSPHPD
jgi:hypothetical protein